MRWGTRLGNLRKKYNGGYPITPAIVTNIHQAFLEIKHFGCDTWEGDNRVAAQEIPKTHLLCFLLQSDIHSH